MEGRAGGRRGVDVSPGMAPPQLGEHACATLVPKPRVNLTRLHCVFAPNSKHRARVTPARRGKGRRPKTLYEAQDRTPTERRASMTWTQRLKRVFNIDIELRRRRAG
jgi:hypothetical protein